MLVIIDVKPKDLGLPTEAYISVEEVHDVSVDRVKCHSRGWEHLGAVTCGWHWLQVLPGVPSHCGPALSNSLPTEPHADKHPAVSHCNCCT